MDLYHLTTLVFGNCPISRPTPPPPMDKLFRYNNATWIYNIWFLKKDSRLYTVNVLNLLSRFYRWRFHIFISWMLHWSYSRRGRVLLPKVQRKISWGHGRFKEHQETGVDEQKETSGSCEKLSYNSLRLQSSLVRWPGYWQLQHLLTWNGSTMSSFQRLLGWCFQKQECH